LYSAQFTFHIIKSIWVPFNDTIIDTFTLLTHRKWKTTRSPGNHLPEKSRRKTQDRWGLRIGNVELCRRPPQNACAAVAGALICQCLYFEINIISKINIINNDAWEAVQWIVGAVQINRTIETRMQMPASRLVSFIRFKNTVYYTILYKFYKIVC